MVGGMNQVIGDGNNGDSLEYILGVGGVSLHIISYMVGGMSQVTGDGNKSNSLENILVVGGVSLHISYMVGGMSSGWSSGASNTAPNMRTLHARKKAMIAMRQRNHTQTESFSTFSHP